MKSKFGVNICVGLILALLLLGLASPFMSSVSADATPTAKIWTDKADYHPGENVTIYGSGFSPFFHVMLEVTKVKDSTVTKLDITTNADGDFSTIYQIDPQGAPLYRIDATDGTNNATTTFTDSPYTLTLSPNHGTVGTTIRITGSDDFVYAGEICQIYYDGMPQTTQAAGDVGDAEGTGYLVFTIPSSTVGSHSIYVINQDWSQTSEPAVFTVTPPPQINLSPNSGNIGSTVTLTAIGMAASHSVTATFNGVSVTLSASTTDSTGELTSTFTTPSAKAGAHTITLSDGTNSPSTSFTTTSVIWLSPASGSVGNPITLTGSGFQYNERCEITFNGNHASQITVGWDDGVYNATDSTHVYAGFSVPTIGFGVYTVHAVGLTSGITADAIFSVTSDIQPITVTMSNSAPSATVTITGGNPSPSTFLADGLQLNIIIDHGSTFTLSFSNSGNTRDGFIVSGAFYGTSGSYTASSNPISVTAYEQVQNTFSVTGLSEADTITLYGTILGTGASTIGALNIGNSWTTTVWSDYNTDLSIPASSSLSSGSERWSIGTAYSSGALTSGGGNYHPATDYYHQYKLAVIGGNGVVYSGDTSRFSDMWYDAGSVSMVSSNWVWSEDAGTRTALTNWQLDSVNQNPARQSSGTITATITMNGAHTVGFLSTTQYQVTFSASGLDANSVGNTLLTVGATNYQYNAVATASGWYDAGTTFSWESIVSGGAGTQFILHSNDDGLTSPINAAGTDTVVYFKQFQVTPYFTVSSGASPTVTNVVRYFYNGAPQTANPTLGSVGGSAFWADEGSAVTYLSPIASGSERWIVEAGDTTLGRNTAIASVSGVQDVTVLYYNQWNVAFAYDTIDGSVIRGISGAAGGIYRFTQFGVLNYITTDGSGTLSAASSYADDNGAVQYHSALDNSNYPATIASGERYMVASSDSGWNTAIAHLTSAGSLGYTYYHQFQDTLSYSIIGGGSPTAPTSTSTLFGISYTPSLTTSATIYWADSGAPWSITNPLTGSSETERWQSNQVLSGLITVGGGVSVITYYHQFDVAFQYIINGNAGTSTNPTAYYTKFGAPSSITATATLTVFPDDWLDSGSAVSYTNPLGGAVDSNGERWQTDGAIVGGKTVINTGISFSQVIIPTYIHQLHLTVTGGNNIDYSNSGSAGHWYNQGDSTTVSSDWVYNLDGNTRTVVTNWQIDNSNQDPTQQYMGTLTTTTITMDAAHTVNFVSSTQYQVTYLTNGNANSVTVPANEWVTSGQTATGIFPASVTVGGVKDTFISTNATATITSATTITGLYQTSYLITVTSAHGSPTELTQWINKGAVFTVSVTSPEVVTADQDRWVVSEPTTQTISNVQAAQTLTFSWTEQFYLTVTSPNGSPTGQGWYNAGSTANFGVTSPDGTVSTRYILVGWSSSDTNGYTGTDATHSITMNNAVTETASWQTQYQVTFAVNPSGSGTTSPAGTGVWANAGSLSIAATQNAGYTFSSWTSTGSISFNNANAASTTATLTGPGTITATFTTNQATNFFFSTIGAQTAGSSFTLTLTVKDAFGNTVPGYTGTVRFTSTDSQAVLPSDYTFQTSDSGTRTFTVTLKTAGTQTVTATDKATDSIAQTTGSITVAHAYAIANLNISPVSSSVTAGSSKTFTITAHDRYGNTWDVTSSTTWSISSDAGGSWNGNVYTSAISGDFTITATYASAAYTTTLTVNPGALDHFSVSAPSLATTGTTFWLTVFPRDAFDNVIKTFSGSVSLNASQGSITPTSATFSSPGWNNTVALSSAGSITIGVNDAEGHSGISAIISVSAPAATPTPTPTSTPSPTPSPSPTSSPTPTPTSNSTITVATNQGGTIEVALSGNITSSQISGALIAANQSAKTTIISFNVTGESGTTGLCNMTFSKSDIPYGATPIVYIDAQQAENQGYTQDSENFYVWFTTHFSSHLVEVQFTGSRTNTPSNSPNSTIIIAAVITVLVVVAAVILVKRNSNNHKQSKYSPKNHPLYIP